MAMAEAFIDRPGQLTGTVAGTEEFAAQITSTAAIAKLKEMVTEKRTPWPTRTLRPDGSIHTVNWKPAGLLIAAAYEKAWPRIDPEGWRAYAREKVIGADGSHLVFQLVSEDCRSAADPEAIAREFLKSPHLSLVNAQEWGELGRFLESRRTGSGLEVLSEVKSVAAAQAMVRIAQESSPGGLSATMEILQGLSDPITRNRAIEHALTMGSTDPVEAEAWLRNASLPPDETEAIRELLVSKPIQRDQ